MDTLVSIKMTGKNPKSYADTVNKLDGIFSAYNENSELYKINSDKRSDKISPDTAEIIRQSITLSDEYGKAVDITSGALTELWGVSTDNPKVPTDEEIKSALSSIDYNKIKVTDTSVILPDNAKLDLGSVAKGYACDVLKKKFLEDGVSCAIVSMGSSSLLYGDKPDKSGFTIEIKNPDGGEPLGTITTVDTCLSTSGGYERFFEADGQKYIHIFDLSTGYPSESDLTSVTVLCDSGVKSDFLSTLIFTEGTAGLKKHLEAGDYLVIAADKNKKIYCSASLEFKLNENSGYSLGETP